MSNNREVREYSPCVDILMGIMRTSKGSNNKNCIRQVVKNYDLDLAMLESKLKVMGGEWRIYKTVNKRDVEKARIYLLHLLIDHPEKAAYIDSEWRTALLQSSSIYGEKNFMLDVDTQDEDLIVKLENLLTLSNVIVLDRIKSPKGWHYITKPFDTREVCKLDYVTLLRDGYHYVKTINSVNKCNCCKCSGVHSGIDECCYKEV